MRRPGLGIQSKLLAMLLGVSMIATAIIGVIGFVSGRDSLRDAAFDRLTSVRELKAREIERTFAVMQQGVILDSRNASAAGASLAFNAAFAELQAATPTAEQQAAVDAYYDDVFVPALETRSGEDFDAALLEPTDPASVILQSLYTAPFDDYDAALASESMDDGSAWSAAREQYHDYFRELVLQLGYEDVLLLDTSGNVVYSAYAGPDLGTNVVTGPYSGSALAEAYRGVIDSNAVDISITTDFARYVPSLNVPTAWIASPIGDTSGITGVLAVQVPIETINEVMTNGGEWLESGFGHTGEVYLAGPDETMRSASRLLMEDPEAFEAAVIAGGTSPEIAAREVQIGGTVLLQPVATTAVESALRGEAGTVVADGYTGEESLVAYAPLDIDGLQWVIVAKVDTAEAFAPVTEFTQRLLITLVAIVIGVALLSLLLAQAFTRPLRRLAGAVEDVAAGDLGVQVVPSSTDEIGDLGQAFNTMSRTLKVKADLLEEQQAENRRLLLSLMPEAVADRYREGEETIALDHEDAAVLYSELVGFDEWAQSKDSGEVLAQLNGIVRGFDEAATRLGVERVRTLREGYLASSGIVVPRVDNARRTVDLAIEFQAVVARFNSSTGAEIGVRVGIAAGTVTSGLIGRESIAYDLWGDAVSVAHRVHRASERAGIFVSDRIQELLGGAYEFEPVGKGTGGDRVWELRGA